MSDDKVRAYDRAGRKILVPKDKVGQLYAMGGRVATRDEMEEHDAFQREAAREEKAGVAGKVASVVGAVGGALNPLMYSGGAGSTGEAFNQGVQKGMTAGASDVAVRKALDATAGPKAGNAYAQRLKDVQRMSPTAAGAGEVAGVAAGSALPLTPAGAIGAAGNVAERGAARVLGGVAGKGVLGRALATGGELAARGGVEGALYGGAQGATEQMLGDPDIVADKVFAAAGHGALHGALYGAAGGAVLGAGGSLLRSAAEGTANTLARALTKGESKVAEGTEPLTTPSEAAAAAPAAGTGAPGVSQMMARPGDAARKLSNQLAVDALSATKTQARDALANVKGGADAVGEYVNRVAIKPAIGESGGVLGAAFKAGQVGRADEILQTIKADKYGRVAEGLSNAVKGTDAHLELSDLQRMIDTQHKAMLSDPTQIAGADAFRRRISLELSALGNAGKVAEPVFDPVTGALVNGKIQASDLFYARAALERQAYEVSQTSSAAGQAYRGFLRDLDGRVVDAIDQAASKAGKEGVGDQIRHWKREWQLASAAESMAEGGAERVQRNNTFGIRESIGALTGLATGHPIMGLATALGGKILRERGSAAGAAVLSRIADLGAVAKVVRGVDEQIGRASRGLLKAPERAPLPIEQPSGPPRPRAEAAIARVRQWQADPERFADTVARQTEPMAATAPELAGGVARRMTDALSFLASKVPDSPPPDPLDPHAPPRLTDAEAAKVARYDWYVEKPARFFDEVAHGKLTFEGAETARALMPGAFAELQQRTAEGLATLAAQGRKPPFAQRQMLGDLLDFAATPAQRPDHAAFLQANAVVLSQQAAQGPAPAKSQATKLPTQRSALDRLEADGPGRH